MEKETQNFEGFIMWQTIGETTYIDPEHEREYENLKREEKRSA